MYSKFYRISRTLKTKNPDPDQLTMNENKKGDKTSKSHLTLPSYRASVQSPSLIRPKIKNRLSIFSSPTPSSSFAPARSPSPHHPPIRDGGRREGEELVAGEIDKESGNCTIIPSHPAEKRKHDRDEEKGKKTIETKKARLSSKNKKKTSLPIGKIILRNPRGRPIIRRPAATEECREGWITGTGAARSKETAPQIRSTTGGRVGARHYQSMLI
ncbi:hypothetical protein GWI33_003859 [Rhynchophorus ferrugineus]|uniref:Uncharacterized protein n=1 Tax=Rhynchophorus ferrugineus TaxID=354439 RepID=A0A834HIC6_RHYFE|nr:hypothetical protein GWI33_003859 [Rhynchophorus ferrugineus]